jgi:DNA-binding transcriptional regulator YiaG
VQNDKKKQNKQQKRTHPLGRKQYMCGKMLRCLRRSMKLEPRDMCAILNLPRRTWQDYEAGKRGIPAKLATRIRELHKRDREFINGIGDRVDAVERGEI